MTEAIDIHNTCRCHDPKVSFIISSLLKYATDMSSTTVWEDCSIQRVFMFMKSCSSSFSKLRKYTMCFVFYHDEMVRFNRVSTWVLRNKALKLPNEEDILDLEAKKLRFV